MWYLPGGQYTSSLAKGGPPWVVEHALAATTRDRRKGDRFIGASWTIETGAT
jgi:hypothetical protein